MTSQLLINSYSNIITLTKRLHNTTSTLLTYTETLILTILNPILRPFTKYSTKLCNTLHTFLVNTVSIALILNPLTSYALPPITPDGNTNTTTDISYQNNVPVVNIAAPSSGGVSYNTYTIIM